MLGVACFAEAERLYMLVKDTVVHGRPLTALVLPDVLVSGPGVGTWGMWPPQLVCLTLWGWSEVCRTRSDLHRGGCLRSPLEACNGS